MHLAGYAIPLHPIGIDPKVVRQQLEHVASPTAIEICRRTTKSMRDAAIDKRDTSFSQSAEEQTA